MLYSKMQAGVLPRAARSIYNKIQKARSVSIMHFLSYAFGAWGHAVWLLLQCDSCHKFHAPVIEKLFARRPLRYRVNIYQCDRTQSTCVVLACVFVFRKLCPVVPMSRANTDSSAERVSPLHACSG